MSKAKRDENGMIMPVKTTYPALTSEKSKLSNVYGTGDKTTDEEPKSTEQAEKENESSGKPIGLDEIHEAMQTFRKYQDSKKPYDERFKQAFKEYNLLYTEATAPQIKGRPRKVLIPKRKGAQALNVIMNKHADAMDNYPEIICLPRAQDDEQAAKTLNSVIPCIHKRNGFIRTYSDEQLDRTLKRYRTVQMYFLPDIMTRKESERYIPNLKAFRLPLSDWSNTKPTTTATSRMIK